MAFNLAPCPCGGTSFHYLPGVTVFHGETPHQARIWQVTMVACTACGRTEMFTQNAAQIAQHCKGATTITAGPH